MALLAYKHFNHHTMGNSLTPKQRGFIKSMGEGKNQTQAALENYDTCPENAKKVGSYVANSPNVRAQLAKAYKDIGLDMPTLARRAQEGLNARIINKDGEDTGHADHRAALGYMKLIYDSMGLGKISKEDDMTKTLNVQVKASTALESEFSDFLRKKHVESVSNIVDIPA